jgi:hypothetical protein
MEKSIKYLDYKIYREGKAIHAGSVPELIALGGSSKEFDLGGIWMTHSRPDITTIEFSYNGEHIITMYSDCKKEEWLTYINTLDRDPR